MLKPNSITLSWSQTYFPTYRRQVRAIERVCDLVSTPKSRKLVADPHELVESQVENQVCDHVCDHVCDLDSVMEFSLLLTEPKVNFGFWW